VTAHQRSTFHFLSCDRHSLAKCPNFDIYCTFSHMQGKILARELDHNCRRICLGVFRFPVCCCGFENSLCNCVFAGLSPMRRHWRNSDRLATSLACEILRMLGIYPRFSARFTRIHEVDVL
jgi:hypothetical protein